MRSLRATAFAALLAAPAVGVATNAPHDGSYLGNDGRGITCASCHVMHNAPGGLLTTQAGNANLCFSCHATKSPFVAWSAADQAIPGTSGHSHRWDAPANAPQFGASAPAPGTPMGSQLAGSNLMCSTCHDPHRAFPTATPEGWQHVSKATGAALSRDGGAAPTSTGTLSIAVAAGSSPRGYLVKIQPVATQFQVSNDNGNTWFGWDGTSWVAGNASGRPLATGTAVALDDGTSVSVTFGGTPQLGDFWRFSVTYPMVRVADAASGMCEACHAQRVQSTACVEGSGTDGSGASCAPAWGRSYSHPVGVALGGTSRSALYDRTATSLLDADGSTQPPAGQAGGDGLRTNDLGLDPGGLVRCMTCHYPHNADSNSLTEDPR